MSLEKKIVDLGGRRYQISALGSKEGTDLLPLVTEVCGPVLVSLLAIVADISTTDGDASNVGLAKAAAGEAARMIQGAPKYPALASAAMRSIAWEAPEAPGRFVPLHALVDETPNSDFFSRRQFEKARLVYEFVLWNYSDFFDGMRQLGPNVGIKMNPPPAESAGPKA